MKTKTAEEKKAEQIYRKHLTAIMEETLDGPSVALACAQVTATTVLNTVRLLMYATEKDYEFWKDVMEILATEDYSNVESLDVF